MRSSIPNFRPAGHELSQVRPRVLAELSHGLAAGGFGSQPLATYRIKCYVIAHENFSSIWSRSVCCAGLLQTTSS